MSKSEMIMLPREVVEKALAACERRQPFSWLMPEDLNHLRAALEQPQPDMAPYLWYDPENGDTWTQEAIDEGLSPTDKLIALYTK